MTLPSEKALARYEAELEEKRREDEDAEAKAQEKGIFPGKPTPQERIEGWVEVEDDDSMLYGPRCGFCQSRRTRRVGYSALRQCQDCGQTGKLAVGPSGAVLEPLEVRQ